MASPCDLECLLLSRCLYTSSNTWPSQACVPSGLFSPIVTAPQGSNLPGCTKTERKPAYPFHHSDTGCLGLLSCGLQMICYFDCNNSFHQKAAVVTRVYSYSTCKLPDLDFMWIISFTDSLMLLVVSSSLTPHKTKPQTDLLYCSASC